MSQGVLRSEVRTPHMPAVSLREGSGRAGGRRAGLAGSIHDDAIATRLGFRGGTIAGSIHMDQFPEILVKAFGKAWFDSGSLSLSFQNATISGEPVVAMLAVPPNGSDCQVRAWMERTDGLPVATGSASVGDPGEPRHLQMVDLRPGNPSELRILAGVQPGSTRLAHRARIESARVSERVENGSLPDPFGWYRDGSAWGAPIASPSALVELLRNRGHEFGAHVQEAVGLFGAIEVRHLGGPVFLDHDYDVEGEVVAAGASPKTEYVWYDTRAMDASGRPVASMRMQLRWMKASSPLYAEV